MMQVTIDNITAINHITDSFNSTSIKTWCGHATTAVKGKLHDAVEKIGLVAHITLNGLPDLRAASYDLVCGLRKFEKYCLEAIHHLSKTQVDFTVFARMLRNHIAVVDFLQLAKDADYFINQRYKEVRDENGNLVTVRDTFAAIGGNVASFVADIGGSVLWLEELGFLKLGQMADAIGKVKVFGCVPKLVSCVPVLGKLEVVSKAARAIGDLRVFSCIAKISLTFVTLRALDLMFAFFAIDSIMKYRKAENDPQKICAALHLSSYIAELALSALLLAGVTNLIGLGVLGGTAITLAFSAFFYRNAHSEEVKPLYGA